MKLYPSLPGVAGAAGVGSLIFKLPCVTASNVPCDPGVYVTENVGISVQFAVTVTAFAGIVNVVVSDAAFTSVTPPDVTVQPAKM